MPFSLFKNQLANLMPGKTKKLPDIVGEVWFNSPKLTFMELAGKVVLVDFWTYSCVNCIRTLPYLRDWWHKYKDMGFLLIGVHTPEFEFEKIPHNVEKAIQDLNVDWPVVLDNDRTNWTHFHNQYWPAKYLTNRKGKIVYTHFGEGSYGETESAIRGLLQDTHSDQLELTELKLKSDEHSHGEVCYIPTPETYCGYEQGPLINPEGYTFDQITTYKLPENIAWGDGLIGLTGEFLATKEYVESATADSTLFLSFHATEVNLVLHPVSNGKVEIRLDHQPLYDEIRGQDVNKKGEILIDQPRMYNLIKTPKLLEGLLEIRAQQSRFQAYAFTFSGCPF